jgi:hypothetical protein
MIAEAQVKEMYEKERSTAGPVAYMAMGQRRSSGPRRELVCWKCGKSGHIRRDCHSKHLAGGPVAC